MGWPESALSELPCPNCPVRTALSELLDAFRAGDGVDLVRESVRLELHELIEVEAAEVIGAARYERSDERVTDRNGHRPRRRWSAAGAARPEADR